MSWYEYHLVHGEEDSVVVYCGQRPQHIKNLSAEAIWSTNHLNYLGIDNKEGFIKRFLNSDVILPLT